jgi:hypothetical protein
MRNCRPILAAAALLALAACQKQTRIEGFLADAPEAEVVVKLLDINKYQTLDTLKTAADGAFVYKPVVEKGKPEFLYLFYKDTKIASLLLEQGDRVKVFADTLGRYTVEGSEGSVELAQVDKTYADFIAALAAKSDEPTEMTRLYIQHYRDCVRYVLSHPVSLTTVPVFFEQLGDAPVFSQDTDAILFRQGADSLKTVYPDSRYVKALEKEADRRMSILEIGSRIERAEEVAFLDINLPDTRGEKRSLRAVDAKVILVHFWDETDPAQKMLSLDTLLPIYEKYHPRGFEIYSICVSTDKPEWASSVLAQKLPWINVCDGLGGASPAVITYNITDLPTSFLIVNGEISTTPVNGVDGLQKELAKLLR